MHKCGHSRQPVKRALKLYRSPERRSVDVPRSPHKGQCIIMSAINQAVYVSCLWGSLGEITDNDCRINIHKALMFKAFDNKVPKKLQMRCYGTKA